MSAVFSSYQTCGQEKIINSWRSLFSEGFPYFIEMDYCIQCVCTAVCALVQVCCDNEMRKVLTVFCEKKR